MTNTVERIMDDACIDYDKFGTAAVYFYCKYCVKCSECVECAFKKGIVV